MGLPPHGETGEAPHPFSPSLANLQRVATFPLAGNTAGTAPVSGPGSREGSGPSCISAERRPFSQQQQVVLIHRSRAWRAAILGDEMRLLGEVDGKGTVRIGEENVGEVEYHIAVYRSGALREARGTIAGDGKVLRAAFNHDQHCTLVLEDEETVEFHVSRISAGTGSAQITVSGAVPGF